MTFDERRFNLEVFKMGPFVLMVIKLTQPIYNNWILKNQPFFIKI